MADRVKIKNTGDAYVDSQLPRRNFSNTQRLYVKANYPGNCRGYLFFGRPFPLGATILKATLTVYNGTNLVNGADLIVNRISDPWRRNRITWEDRPGVNGGEARASKNNQNIPAGTRWEVDVTALLQQVAEGAPWYGLQITCNDGRGDWFYGSASQFVNYRPMLEIEYVDKPDVPTNLSPSNTNTVVPAKPVLSFDWTDDRGSSAIQAVDVRLAKNAAMTTSLWSSGWRASEVPQLDTSLYDFPGAAENETWFWQARVRDGSGVESGWSEVASFRRQAKGVVNILNPATGTPNFVEESTPTVSWSFSMTQVAWQVIVFDPNDSNEVLADSGKITGTQTGWSVPLSARLRDGKLYETEVRVWDNNRRERNSGEPAYASARKQFQVVYTTATAPVTSFTVTQVQPYAWAQLQWQRSTAPDAFEIYMGTRMVSRVPAAEVFVSGTTYRLTVRNSPPRKNIVWRVVAVVGGRGSANAPTVTTEFALLGPILSELDGSNPVIFLNYAKDEGEANQQTVHEVIGDYPPVLVKQAQGGKDGSFSGGLYGAAIPGVSVETEKARIDQLKKGEGRKLLFTMIDDSIECFIANTDVQTRVDGEGVFYEVGFEYYQTDAR